MKLRLSNKIDWEYLKHIQVKNSEESPVIVSRLLVSGWNEKYGDNERLCYLIVDLDGISIMDTEYGTELYLKSNYESALCIARLLELIPPTNFYVSFFTGIGFIKI